LFDAILIILDEREEQFSSSAIAFKQMNFKTPGTMQKTVTNTIWSSSKKYSQLWHLWSS